MDLLLALLPWYLAIGSVLGIAIALSLKRVLDDNPRERKLLDDSVASALAASPGLRLQIEMLQAVVIPGIALFMAVTWLPMFALYFVPAFFKAFAEDFREWWKGEETTETEDDSR